MSLGTLWEPGAVFGPADLTPATIQAITDALSPAQVLALTARAEARSRFVAGQGWGANPLDALVEILNVVDNRAKDPRWQSLGHKGICLQRRQFSCWNMRGGADNFYDLMQQAQRLLAGVELDEGFRNVLAAAHGCVGGALIDDLRFATHYYAPASMVPPGRVPGWVAGAVLTAERWGHRFYREVR